MPPSYVVFLCHSDDKRIVVIYCKVGLGAYARGRGRACARGRGGGHAGARGGTCVRVCVWDRDRGRVGRVSFLMV